MHLARHSFNRIVFLVDCFACSRIVGDNRPALSTHSRANPFALVGVAAGARAGAGLPGGAAAERLARGSARLGPRSEPRTHSKHGLNRTLRRAQVVAAHSSNSRLHRINNIVCEVTTNDVTKL